MKKHSLKIWIFLTFSITWGIAASFILMPDFMNKFFGEISYSNPFFWIASYAPLIASIIVIACTGGKKELLEFIKKIVQFNFGLKWYAYIIIGIPLMILIAAIPTGLKIHTELTVTSIFMLIINNIFIGALGEEPGWKGVLLQKLLTKYTPLVSSLILGVIWAVWHLPAYLISSTPQGSHSILAEYIGFVIIALGFETISTWIYIHTKGNIVASGILLHFMYNVSMTLFEPTHIFAGIVFVLTAIIIFCVTKAQWITVSDY